jgi:hypothetical protein
MFDLGKQRQLIGAAADSLTVDQSLDLFQLAGQMQTVTPGNIHFQTVPYVGDDHDDQGRYILRLQDTDTLQAFFTDLSAEPEPATPTETTAPATVAPAQVRVAVYNGSGTSGLAATTATGLTAQGFAVTGTGNADNAQYTATEIRYASGDEALANTLAASIPGATVTQSDEATQGNVELVLGSDFNGVGQAVTPSAPTAPTEGEDPRTAADTTCIN